MTAVLLLTSTLVPPAGATVLAVVDPDERLRHYERALRFYATLVPHVARGIVYADNSGADLGPVRRLADELGVPVEVLATSQTPAELGRGEGEARIVDDAVAGSATIAAGGPDELTWKVTGRYVVRNLDRVVAGAPAGADVHLNVRRHPGWWADTYVYGFTRAGYELCFAPDARARLGLVGGLHPPMEVKAAAAVRTLLEEGAPVAPRFAVEPRVTGVRGMDGRPYEGPRQRAKWWVRTGVRKVAPCLWV